MTLSVFVSFSYLALVLGILAYGFTAFGKGEHKPGTPGFSRAVDEYTERVARTIAYLIVLTIVVSAANAISRYALNMASNAWLELQWSLYAAAFLFGASWALKGGDHVRIDIVSSNLPIKARNWIDVFGHVVFLIPFCLIHLWYGFDYVSRSIASGETSTHAGGLIYWPAKLILMLGFSLLLLQGISELVKRVAIIRGVMPQDGTNELTPAEREALEALEALKASGAVAASGAPTGALPAKT
jgi:TRAP-type mannitol/chloroaromatic compound transport system permease small subunit